MQMILEDKKGNPKMCQPYKAHLWAECVEEKRLAERDKITGSSNVLQFSYIPVKKSHPAATPIYGQHDSI